MVSYDATTAQPPVAFPLSGPPVCVALGAPSHKGLMRTVHDETTGANLIELSDDIHNATSLEKFWLEPSQEKVGLLHVKCCSNNKYWVAQQLRPGRSHSPWFICSVGDEPEEDLDKPSCTLFDFRPHPQLDSLVRIFHPQHKKYASVFYMSGPTRGRTYLKLRDDQGDDSGMNLFRFRCLSQQMQLPRYVAFKGPDGKYLAVKEPYLTQKDPYLQFSSSEITDPAVVHETFTDEYGVVRIRSNSSDKYWRLNVDGWISADSDDSVYDSDHVYHDAATLFKVVILDDNYIALQSIRNGKFCKSLSNQGEVLWLNASADDTSMRETTLLFEEPIRSRKVYDVQYRVGGNKTSTNNDIHRTEVLYENATHDIHSDTTTIKLFDRNESSWKLDVTADAGIKTHLTASLPIKRFKLGCGIEGHLGIKGEYTSGEAKIKSNTRLIEYTYPIPPNTKVVCTTFTREDVVDVPFSYKQKVVLFNGEIVPPRVFHDGVYRGVTSFDTDIDTHEEKVTADDEDA